jgi:type I restriction enzyme, S subunit
MILRAFNIVPLGELLEETPRNGYSPVCPELPTGKWVLGLSALNGHGLDLSEPKPAPANDPFVDKFVLRLGDFLISRSNTFEKVGRGA